MPLSGRRDLTKSESRCAIRCITDGYPALLQGEPAQGLGGGGLIVVGYTDGAILAGVGTSAG
jgi:hypothetical protein